MKNLLKKYIPKKIINFFKKIIHMHYASYINKNFGTGIKKYKNKYKNQRCFIIGNGPSLLIEDLEKLKNENTFASHMIYKVFNETDWRPKFYCVEDIKLLTNNLDDLQKLCNDNAYEHGFFTGNMWKDLPNSFLKSEKNDFWYIFKLAYNGFPDFSLRPNKYLIEGYTVTYAIIQLAVYMGFTEIYLLGVDHHYEKGNNYSKSIGETEVYNIPLLDKSTLSYKKAREICEKKKIKIVNLTRGGYLETFERKSFDSVIGD